MPTATMGLSLPSILDVARMAGFAPLHESGDEYRIPCPNHPTQSPRMTLNESKRVYFCHTCNVGGGVLEFSRLLGVDVQTGASQSAAEDTSPPKSSPHLVPVQAAGSEDRSPAYWTALWERLSSRDADGEAYLQRRGIDPKAVCQEVRYNRNLSDREGLPHTDNRVAVRLREADGSFCGAVFRSIKDGQYRMRGRGKRAFFGDIAAMSSANRVVVVEGMTDYLTALQSLQSEKTRVLGLRCAGAELEDGLRLMFADWMGEGVILIPDADEPGQKIMSIAATVLCSLGVQVKTAYLPEGIQDLNDLLTKKCNKSIPMFGVELRQMFSSAVRAQSGVPEVRVSSPADDVDFGEETGSTADLKKLSMNSIPSWVALVSKRTLARVLEERLHSYARKSASQKIQGISSSDTAQSKKSKVAPAMLALQIETLLRSQMRTCMPYTKQTTLAKMLGVGKSDINRAVAWLEGEMDTSLVRKHGRGRESWVVPIPLTEEQLWAEYVPVPFAAVRVLDSKHFFALARLHALAEQDKEKQGQKDQRAHVIPSAYHLGWLSKSALYEHLLTNKKTAFKMLEHLDSKGFFRPKDRELTPLRAKALHAPKNGKGELTLLESADKSDANPFSEFRGE